MSNFNSINNNGIPYYFPVDIAKEGQQYQRFTDWLKTRVNDNGKKVPFKWYDQGRVMNVNGMTPFIRGMVGHFTTDDNDELIPSSDVVSRDWQGTPADVTDGGIAFYTLEDQFFCQEGKFKGVFGLRDNAGNTYTSVNIVFEILGNDLRMGETTKYYSSKLDRMVQEFQVRTDEAVDDLYQKYKDKTQKVQDELDLARASAKTIQDRQDTIDAKVQDTQDKINQNQVVVKKDFDDLKDELVSYNIPKDTRKKIVYNGYWSNLDQSHSGGVYTSSLDDIKRDIDQMAPLVDGVVLLFHQFISNGKLTVLENIDTFKQAVDYAKSKGLEIAGYKFHCSVSIDDIKDYEVDNFFTQYKANIDKVTGALPEAGVPIIAFNERGDLYGASSPYHGNVLNVLQELVGSGYRVEISFQSLQDFATADIKVQEIVDAILINMYPRISDKKFEVTMQDVSSGIDVNTYNLALYVHSLYPKKPLIMSEFGIKNNWAAFDEPWNWDFSSVYDDSTGKVPFIYIKGLMQSESIKLFDGVWLWFYADLLQSKAGREYLSAYKRGTI